MDGKLAVPEPCASFKPVTLEPKTVADKERELCYFCGKRLWPEDMAVCVGQACRA